MFHVMHDAAPAAPVRVDAGRLHHSGRELTQVGAGLVDDVADWPALVAAGRANGGWSAGPAAEQAAHQWRDLLATCGGELGELGGRIVEAVSAYQRCDALAAARYGGVVPQ